MQIYHYYKQARDASWRCLLECGITQLPVKLFDITTHFGVIVLKNSEVGFLDTGVSGCAVVDESGRWRIIYDDTQSKQRCRFTIAHELGHILLGHELRAGFSHYRTFEKRKPVEETQADEFAARLLAPACVLWALDLHNPREIALTCDISDEAAKVRAERMSVLYKRQKFLTSPLEKQVLEQFRHWIDNKGD